jgi:hypothetical protein
MSDEKSGIMSIDQIVNNLTRALNEYAIATQSQDKNKMKRLRDKIRNIIQSYQPENTQDGIFDDIVSLLPEGAMEQLEQVQFNILNDIDEIIPINTENMTFSEKIAKNFLLGKASLKLLYDKSINQFNELLEKSIVKIIPLMSNLPNIPIYNNTLRDFLDQTIEDISQTQSIINDTCKETKETLVKNANSVISFIDIIQDTAEQLWSATPPGYKHKIWEFREDYVNDQGELVDRVQQIRLDMIIEYLKRNSCGRKLLSLPVGEKPFMKIEEKTYRNLGPKTLSAPAIPYKNEWLPYGSDTEIDESDIDDDVSDTASEGSDMMRIDYPDYSKKRGRDDDDVVVYQQPASKKRAVGRGGKTKKNKRKSKKVKRKSRRNTYKNKRNRRGKKNKTRVKK